MTEALFKIREFLEKHGADQDTMKEWEIIRDWITMMIGEMLIVREEVRNGQEDH
ncbi:MAG: hypothetical protein IKE08_04115 [Clostridia bacterium]|nr:hypothetical protein [Clostridia bacterium]